MLRTTYITLLALILVSIASIKNSYAQPCDPVTPSYVIDLTGNPDSVWASPPVVRDGHCCSASGSDRCIEFIITLDSAASGIQFNIISGAIPPGALFYEVGCANPTQVGDTLCLDGPGPHRITFCKPGNNTNEYEIVSIPKPAVSPPITVTDGCSGIIYVEGLDETTIHWEPIPYDTTYLDYMSCTDSCDTVFIQVTQPGYPPFIDFEVTGYSPSLCDTAEIHDTVRVYFVSDKLVEIQPQNPVVCFGGSATTITANASGGAPPYSYLWSTGETTQSINVGVGTYWVEVTDTTNCPAVYDTVEVTAHLSPISVDAGPDQASCTNQPTATFNATVNVADGGIWSGGNGSYSPSDTSLTLDYTPTPSEISAGSMWLYITTTGNDGCPAETDSVMLTIEPAPTVDAGANQVVCGDVGTVNLSGSYTNAGGVQWTTSGSGTFGNAANPVTSYTPSSSDTAAGSITLTLTTTNTGACAAVSDVMTITFTDVPTVNAGPDQSVCGDVSSVGLSGNITVATGGTWTTSGTGSFSPNANTLGADYIPSSLDTASGSVTLTLTSTGNGDCNAYSDQVTITFYDPPTVDAGPDQTVCADIGLVDLNPSTENATGFQWSTSGSGSFTPSSTTEFADYDPSLADTANGTVTLTLTVTGQAGCNSYSDDITVTINPAPVVNAGPDQTVCGDVASVSLSGTIYHATGGNWTTSGSGSFSPSSTSLSGNYIPSSADTAAGSVTLTLTSTGNGLCNAYTDQVVITFTDIPQVNAGPDQTVCADVGSVPLSGSVTNAGGGTWSTSGTGSFSPGNTSLGGSYIPSNSDTTAGTVTLTLTSTGNGGCNAYSDQMTITITPAPVVDAGPDQTVCGDENSIALNGDVWHASGGTWTTSGTGSFSPGSSTLNANYLPTSSDTAAGSVTLTLTSTGNGGCNAYSDQMTITFTDAPTVDAGADITTCKDVTSVPLSGTVTNASGGIWSTSGSGSFNPSNTNLNASYVPSSADTAAGSVTITLTTTGNGLCNAYTDQLTITFTDIPTVDAGPDQTICADASGASLSGSVTIATGGIWSTSGTGTFSPSNTNLGATYIPSASDTAAGSVTLTLTTTGNGGCNAYSDQMTITITPAPIVDAGADQTVCGDVGSVTMNGSVTHATGGTWSTSGTGTFSPSNTDLNADYIPSSSDTAAGTVTLTLTSTGNGSCNAYSDDVVITFTDAPTVNAGPDQTVCADVASVGLSGSVTNATGGIWSTSGSGSFTPSNTNLSPNYIPSSADTAAGSVTITLTTTGNGLCNAYTDQMTITFTPIPTVDAGPDQTICADAGSVTLNGNVTVATGGTWSSTGTGSFSPSNTNLGANYIPSASDTAAGSVTLTLTTTGNGGCNAYSDQMVVTITPAPMVNAGPDQTVCGDVGSVTLNGDVTHATGGSWSTSGSGTFSPNNTDLNADYLPSSSDTAAGSVTIVLTTTGNGACNAYTDTLIITFTDAPTVNAGTDVTICKDVTSIPLSGSVTTASGGIWSTSGSGTFNPNNTTLTASYIPSSADTAAGSVTLTLTTTGNGGCNAYTDNITITFTDIPVVDAGPDQTVCADIASVSLSGSVQNATGGVWSSNGTGTFSPGTTNLNASYTPSAADTANGSVTLTLTSTGNGTCQAYNDQMTITIDPQPKAFAGNDTTVCETSGLIPLGGSVMHATGGQWTTNGSGTFTPNNTDLNASYQSSVADQANGSVEIYLTTTGNGLCNPVTDTMVINITPSTITVNAGADTLVCGDDSLALNGVVQTAQGGVWNTTGDGTFSDSTDLNASYYFGPNDTTTNSVDLWLTTTGNGGCAEQIDSFHIDIQDPLQLSVASADTACKNGGPINLSSSTSTGQGYWITNGDGTFLPDTTTLNAQYQAGATDTANGSVVLTFITSNNGVCSAINDSVVIELIDAPSVNFGYQDICLNDTILFTDSSSAIGGITSWTWTFDDSIYSSQPDTSVIFGSVGTHTAELVIESGYGCLDSLEQIVTVSPLPTADFTSNADCYVDSVQVFDASTVSSGSVTGWDWSINTGFTSNAQDFSTTFDSAGVYFVTLIATTDMGCTDTITDSIRVQPNPIAAFVADSVCLNDTTSLVDQSTVEFGQIVSWEWTLDPTTTDTLQNTNHVFTQDSTNSVMLIVESNYGCIDTLVQDVFVHPLPNADFSYQGFCEEDPVLFTDESTINFGQITGWDWDFGNATSNEQHPDHTYGVTGGFNVSLIAYSDQGCSDTITQLITISPNPTAEFDVDPDVVQVLDPTYFTDQSIDAQQWDWDFGDTLGTSTNQNPTYNYYDYGNYTVTLVITNSFGCTDTVQHPVLVVQPPKAPTGFTPNGDGLNDVFNILGGEFVEFQLQIYNNWGKSIFITEDPLQGWDGTHNGQPQPNGAYVYVYRVVTEDGTEYNGHGDVTILR